MKKTLVALTVAAMAATSASAATVYNQDGTKLDISGSLRLVLAKTTDHRADLQNNGSRVTFDFTQQIGEGFYGLGQIEFRPEGDDFGSGVVNTRMFGGFGAEGVGKLTFGKQLTTGDDFKLADPTYKATSVIGDSFMYDAGNKVVKFKSESFDGLSFGANYVFDMDSSRHYADGKYNKNDFAWQAGLFYDKDYDGLGVKANAVYSQTHGIKAHKELNANTYGLALGLSYADFGVAFDYVEDRLSANVLGNTKNRNTWEAALTYKVNPQAGLYTQYHHVNNVDFAKDVEMDGIAVGADYWLAKNVLTFVEYNTQKQDNKDRNHGYYTGLRVYF